MVNFGWRVFQISVFTLVLVGILAAVEESGENYGMAPPVIAWGVTYLLTMFLGWLFEKAGRVRWWRKQSAVIQGSGDSRPIAGIGALCAHEAGQRAISAEH